MMNWFPKLRWRVLEPDEALELGCEVRWRWELLELTWLRFGLGFMVRPIRT